MTPAARQPLILVPGLLCDAALWAPQAAALSDIADITIADVTRSDDMTGLATDVLRGAPPRFALAGLSMGGYVSLAIMRAAPERVTRLALLDTNARADTPEATARRRSLMEQAQLGRFNGISERLLRDWIHPDGLENETLVRTVIDMTARVGRDAFIRQQTAIIGRADIRPWLSRIACPTLVLCGRQDRVTPVEVMREIAADIPSSRMVVVEDCGHLSTLERPDAVNAALRSWLTAD